MIGNIFKLFFKYFSNVIRIELSFIIHLQNIYLIFVFGFIEKYQQYTFFSGEEDAQHFKAYIRSSFCQDIVLKDCFL